jgi:hypothetical protein
MTVSANNTQDFGYMLGQIDGKLDGIQALLTSIVQRADDHEARIKSLEAWHQSVTGQARGAKSVAKVAWSIVAALTTLVTGMGGFIASQLMDFKTVRHTEPTEQAAPALTPIG